MPLYDVDVENKTYEVSAPDENTAYSYALQFYAEERKKAQAAQDPRFLSNTMASMTLAGKGPLERAAIQLGAGADTVRQGIRQLFANEEERKAIDREVAAMRPLKKALAAQTDTKTLPSFFPTGGEVLQGIGEALPLMAVPVGAYANVARALPRALGLSTAASTPARVGTGALIGDAAIAGSVAGALNPVINDESRLMNAAVGGAASTVTPAALGAGRGAYNMVTQRGGQNRAGAQVAQEITEGAPDRSAALQATIGQLRAARQGNIPLTTAAVLRDPALARLEAGSRARRGDLYYDFDQAQARAVADELTKATSGATQIEARRNLRSRNRELLYNQAMGSVNEPAFASNLTNFRSNLETAMQTAESSNPAVRNMLQSVVNEIDRLGPNFGPENLAVIRANLAAKQPMNPQTAYQAAPRDSPATMSVMREIDDILNRVSNNRWSSVLDAYKRDSDLVRASQAAGKVRELFYEPDTGRVRKTAADPAGDVPLITEFGLGSAIDRTRQGGRSMLDPTAQMRLQSILDALRSQRIVQGVKRSATAGGGSNTASDQFAAKAAGQVGDVVSGMAGGGAGAVTRGALSAALNFANNQRDRALAEALQNPQKLIEILEGRLAANQPLSAAEEGVLQLLRGVPATVATQ
jgi:hypothetical protein